MRGTGNAYTGTATGFNVAAVPSASAGVKDRWTLSYLGNDRNKIVNQYRNQMLRMAQDDYGGTSALSSVAMVANGSPTTPDQWIVQPYATGGVRLVSVGFGRPLHSAATRTWAAPRSCPSVGCRSRSTPLRTSGRSVTDGRRNRRGGRCCRRPRSDVQKRTRNTVSTPCGAGSCSSSTISPSTTCTVTSELAFRRVTERGATPP